MKKRDNLGGISSNWFQIHRVYPWLGTKTGSENDTISSGKPYVSEICIKYSTFSRNRDLNWRFYVINCQIITDYGGKLEFSLKYVRFSIFSPYFWHIFKNELQGWGFWKSSCPKMSENWQYFNEFSTFSINFIKFIRDYGGKLRGGGFTIIDPFLSIHYGLWWIETPNIAKFIEKSTI